MVDQILRNIQGRVASVVPQVATVSVLMVSVKAGQDSHSGLVDRLKERSIALRTLN